MGHGSAREFTSGDTGKNSTIIKEAFLR